MFVSRVGLKVSTRSSSLAGDRVECSMMDEPPRSIHVDCAYGAQAFMCVISFIILL